MFETSFLQGPVIFSFQCALHSLMEHRIAHRLRDMQTLPYVVVSNSHISYVYELYYKAFEMLRRVPEIKTVADNDQYCTLIGQTLQEHLTVIPRLAIGVLECQNLMSAESMDKFMNTLLRSVRITLHMIGLVLIPEQRISRRVIAEQHISLTETFHSARNFPDAKPQFDPNAEFVGEVFLKCSAREVVEECGAQAKSLASEAYGDRCILPEILIKGHLDATFPYILSQLQYIIGEILRNSIQAVVEKHSRSITSSKPPPIEVLICEAPQHVIMRISDQGGGIPTEVLSGLWSFSKGARSQTHLRNLLQVPKMAATMQELRIPSSSNADSANMPKMKSKRSYDSSLSSLTSRPPNLRLGIGLPMSRVYAEYWAGSLELHSLEGYGVDAFLQISKLGNKNEQLSTRASMDRI